MSAGSRATFASTRRDVAFDPGRLDELWAQVPPEFRVWSYDLDQPPFDQALRYVRPRRVTLGVGELSESVRREVAWWVWSGPACGIRRVQVDALARLLQAVNELPASPVLRSLVEPTPTELLKAYRAQFHRRLGRLPSASVVKDFTTEVRLLQDALARVYSPLPWWRHDV